MLYRQKYRPRYFFDMTFDIERDNLREAFDIVYDTSKRYRMIYVRYRRYETSISTTLSMTFDIEGLSPSDSESISISVIFKFAARAISSIFDIDIRYPSRSCKTSISNGHSISKSSISNVTLDIEGLTRTLHLETAESL